MNEALTVMKWPLIACLLLPGMLVYLGLHIVKREIIFVDLALAQVAALGTCLGLLHLVDGLGRMLGAAFALAVYGWMRHSQYKSFYWPVVVASFMAGCTLLHLVALSLARNEPKTSHPLSLQQAQAVALDGPQLES